MTSEVACLPIGDEQTCSLDNDSIVVFDLFCFCDVLEESFLVLFSPEEEDEEEEEEDVEEAQILKYLMRMTTSKSFSFDNIERRGREKVKKRQLGKPDELAPSLEWAKRKKMMQKYTGKKRHSKSSGALNGNNRRRKQPFMK